MHSKDSVFTCKATFEYLFFKIPPLQRTPDARCTAPQCEAVVNQSEMSLSAAGYSHALVEEPTEHLPSRSFWTIRVITLVRSLKLWDIRTSCFDQLSKTCPKGYLI
jgi:hypothetical protein